MLCCFEDLQFRILDIARFSHRDGTYMVKGRRFAALSFRESGTGSFAAGGEKFDSCPGDVIFIPANVDYMVSYAGGGSSLVIHLSECNYTAMEHLGHAPYLAGIFAGAVREWEAGKQINRAKASVFEILALLEKEKTAGKASAALTRTELFLKENYRDAGLSVSAICRAAHQSESTLRREFRHCYGISVWKYLDELRMNAAIRLLLAGEKTVREIAAECGFSDEKYFSRKIRARFGQSPFAFRRREETFRR